MVLKEDGRFTFYYFLFWSLRGIYRCKVRNLVSVQDFYVELEY